MIGVAANREFGDYSLLDVYEWRPGMFGVAMLCLPGFKGK
jgi:hypothetical protein